MCTKRLEIFFLILLSLVSCSPFSASPRPGPDKQGSGMIVGAAGGATAGAVIAAQNSISTTTGGFVGAGLGAFFGLFSGLGVDLLEEDSLRREAELKELRARTWVQERLAEHYAKRLEVHPSRDVFPADWFFDADGVKLKPEARVLVDEIGKFTKRRMPWSRIKVSSYVVSEDETSDYARFLSEKRAQNVAQGFVMAGIEPRRIIAEGIIPREAVIVDPYDFQSRYRQAVEIILLDY